MKNIDIESWKRKEHYVFYSGFDDPFFNIVVNIDCTQAFKYVKENNHSFFAFYLYCSSLAIDNIMELKHRILDDKVVEYDNIHIASTIGRDDGSFAFSFVNFNKSFLDFNAELQYEILNVQNSKGLRLNEDDKRLDVIHYSTMPWNSFTGLNHPRSFNNNDSVPKIVFGKAEFINGKRMMPVSLSAHHGLVDGIHAAQYFSKFEQILKSNSDIND
ncbi:MAG: chloramphenicol acetyltransferase [Saprospiraceae bacterium]